MKRRGTKIMGVGMFAIGAASFLSSNFNITGAVLGSSGKVPVGFFISLSLCIVGLAIFSTAHLEHRVELHSAIKKYPPILRLTEQATKNQDVEREMNHLIHQFMMGNPQAGLGAPGHLSGTPIHYLRGRNGARLFYIQNGAEEYTIVGKASKANEQQVIDKLRELYGRKH